jgi:hypothetical protein
MALLGREKSKAKPIHLVRCHSAASACAPKRMPWFWCLVRAARRIASGNPSNSACQLPRRGATLVAIGSGFAARSIPTTATAGAAWRCFTALGSYLPAGAVTAWPMPASRRRPCTAALIERKRSGCGSAEVRTYVSRSRKSQNGCTGGRTCVFGLAASHRPQGRSAPPGYATGGPLAVPLKLASVCAQRRFMLRFRTQNPILETPMDGGLH